MGEAKPSAEMDLRAAFRDHERQTALHNLKVGTVLVITLMPLGTFLDFFVYRDRLFYFLWLRLACSCIAGAILALLCSGYGKKLPRWPGTIVPLLPVIFIAWMIKVTEGFESPYYAGLNLALLAVGAVLRWTLAEAIFAVIVVLGLYLASGFLNVHPIAPSTLVNNLYFIVLMDIIVVVGTYFSARQRFREFALRFELDVSKRQLEETNQKLTELDQIKSRFFANISHELRTPLTLLLAPLESLQQRFGRSVDEDTRGLLLTMHANGMRLLKLINDLLDLVRLESGVMQVRRDAVPLPEFLRGLANAARQMAQDKRIRLETDVSDDVGVVVVDRDKLEKILLNLQFNALKFTPAGGRVELSARREGEELVLQVTDTGMGIPAKHLPQVFERFFQVDTSARRKFQGVGIGLALVKELTEVQGGKVSVQSQEDVGTTFTVRLPFLVPDPNAPAVEEESTQPSGASSGKSGGTVSDQEWLSNLYRRAELFPGMASARDAVRPVEAVRNGHLPKALIADDEPDMLRFLKSQLADRYQVIEAVDGQQAVDKAGQFLPDVILLDMMMPEKDGLQACRELRQQAKTQAIPVILLTARADEETKLAALEAGANDFLSKPFSITELHVRVKNLVDSYHYQCTLSKEKQKLETTIEQLKETETQLVQTEKLASLGRLSAGIIHEINNPLNFASTGLYTLRSKARFIPEEERDDYAEILKDIEEGIGRVKTIVSDLRTFTHPGDNGRDEVKVWEVVSSSLRFLSQEWKEKVSIRTDIPPELMVWGERNKLIQVMVNLLQNSLDALKVKAFPDEKPTIGITGRVERGFCVITVRDNGEGIDPLIMGKIFDPFFTTKEVGQGMGLGLSICYRIVQNFGGRIGVQSEHGKFCEFTLEFPTEAPVQALQP